MKILMQSRGTLLSVPGGDTIQLMKTADALRRQGHTVDISMEISPKLAGFDIVHVFNLMRPQETSYQARNARRYGLPVALSTIFGPYLAGDRHNRKGLQGFLSRHLDYDRLEYLKVVARAIFNQEWHSGVYRLLFEGYRKAQEHLLRDVDVLLPNSLSEATRVIRHFPSAEGKKVVVVPNAIDQGLFFPGQADPNYGEPFLLCVARIESRKSQVLLARAAAELNLPLVIVGKPGPNSMEYFLELNDWAKRYPKIRILNQLPHEDLPGLYRSCKVHALISWMESPGLSSLEAAACGANLVVTPLGDTEEYFGNYAHYCHPADFTSVCKAIQDAWSEPANQSLATHVRERFTWEAAAEATMKGYQSIERGMGHD